MEESKQRFVEFYLQNFQLRKSVMLACPELTNPYSAQTIAWAWIRDTSVKAEISRRLREIAMGADEVLSRLARIATVSMELFTKVTPDGRVVEDLQRAYDEGNGWLIKSIELDKTTGSVVKITLRDADAALALLAKAHGLLTDRVAITGEVNVVKTIVVEKHT